jgi:hypothetical protein
MLPKVDGHAYCQADPKLRLAKRALSPFLRLGQSHSVDVPPIQFLRVRSPEFHLTGAHSGVIAATN